MVRGGKVHRREKRGTGSTHWRRLVLEKKKEDSKKGDFLRKLSARIENGVELEKKSNLCLFKRSSKVSFRRIFYFIFIFLAYIPNLCSSFSHFMIWDIVCLVG